jgi:hypothetical protein
LVEEEEEAVGRWWRRRGHRDKLPVFPYWLMPATEHESRR